MNGFSAKAYEIPASLDKIQAATDYFADINQLLALPPTGSARYSGRTDDDPNATGMDFRLDQDFSEVKSIMTSQCFGSTLIKMENMSGSENFRNACLYLHCPVI